MMLEQSSHPRSLRAKDSVLTATTELLAEGGLPAATVDAVSARSGVSKATIYKHWPCRTAIAAEAFGKQMAAAIPQPDKGNAHDDLAEQVRRVSEFYAGPEGLVFAQLLAASVTDPAASPYFRKYFLDLRRAAVAELWQRALDRGEVKPQISAETATDILFGPLIFRLMTGHAPLTAEEADKISAACLHGLLKD
ncbi:TetR/AcrR family transcriptional regulator [Streptomyces sp. SID13031]|uniref:TetR/AcrR family transcriptional regulator n=1 Tax=Streptomyces sp. SID13031 TaxID=2706046 RepID=UPI001944931D|nr:TetR/AcrR family transcriptional regulator [Streptomyces sp. SID13031]